MLNVLKKGLSKQKGKDNLFYYPVVFTLVLIAIIVQYRFYGLDAIVYDFFARHNYLSSSLRDKIVIVRIDQESDLYLGEIYPYSYASHKRFFEKILAAKPFLVGHLAQFGEPESDVERKSMDETLKLLENYILEGGRFRFGTMIDTWGETLPPQPFRFIGSNLAMINIDNNSYAKDDVSRRMILNVSGEDTFHLWAANQLRQASNLPIVNTADFMGSYYMAEADANFSMFKYADDPRDEKHSFTVIPFHKVLVGAYPQDFFKDKIVLIGPNYFSNLNDRLYTPFNKTSKTSSAMAIHANVLSAMFFKNSVIMAPWWVVNGLVLVIGIVLSFSIYYLKPTRGLMLTVSLMVSFIILNYLLYVFFGVFLPTSHVLISVFIIYYVWVPFKAISEYQTRYSLEKESKLLKEVEDLKKNFISLMSHDLKTPVAKIIGMAEAIMRQQNLPENVSRNVMMISEATKELNSFISSIIDLSKIESQKISLDKTSKDINALIVSVTDSLKYELNNKNSEINLQLAPLYPITVDATLVKRIISNVVENSIKYAGVGRLINIRTEDDDQWVYVKISDNGVGMAPEHVLKIFDKFYRVKSGNDSLIKGSGLGLYLVKYFVELHGGTISVASTIGEGTEFVIKLPNN